MIKKKKHIKNDFPRRVLLLLGVFSLMVFSTSAQSKVTSRIDTTSIKIGEQIQYTITVETDSTNLVYFPEDQTFSPLEMVEALTIDSIRNKNRITLQRIYALTQFDSGHYTIPPQRIEINESPFLTDSFKIRVADVVVDTTKQKMFDIKPLIKVERSYAKLWKILLWILAALIIIGALVYWFFLRKKPLTDAEKVALLPPFDRAMIQLQELENSKYLIHGEHKKYYSELTNIVRSYLEEDVHITALESTTDQLLEKLILLKDAGELDLQDTTIDQFKRVLQTADLVKFAKSKPTNTTAEKDREIIQQLVTKTKDALPEPTEEELLLNQEYLEELQKKKQRKRIWLAAAVVGLAILTGSIASIAIYGFKEVKDTVVGYPTKELLEGEWVKSGYGFPPMYINAPDVLKRSEGELVSNLVGMDTVNEATKKAAMDLLKNFNKSKNFEISEFLLDADIDHFYLKYEDMTLPVDSVNTATLANEAQAGIELFEKQERIKNIIVKDDVYYTPEGAEGLKQYGTLAFKNKKGDFDKKKYTIINFMRPGNLKRLTMIWNIEDIYAEKIVEKVMGSIEIKAE